MPTTAKGRILKISPPYRYSFLNDELEQRYTITKEIKILIIGTHKKNTDYRHYPSGSGLFHTSAVLSPGLSETDSEFWASSTSIPFFILSWMSYVGKNHHIKPTVKFTYFGPLDNDKGKL